MTDPQKGARQENKLSKQEISPHESIAENIDQLLHVPETNADVHLGDVNDVLSEGNSISAKIKTLQATNEIAAQRLKECLGSDPNATMPLTQQLQRLIADQAQEIKELERAEFRSRVLSTLRQPQYSALRDVFGSVVEMRLKSSTSESSLIRLLASNLAHLLRSINDLCASYIRALGDSEKARGKCEADLRKRAKKDADSKFSGAFGDFFAEMAAVSELSKMGVTEFEPVLTGVNESVDYRAKRAGKDVCIEVKNIRAPITIFDFCADELRRLHAEAPTDYPFRLTVRCETDNTITAAQQDAITTYLASVKGRKVPFEDSLKLEHGVRVVLTVRAGSGQAMQLRAMRVDAPDTLNIEGFLNKVHDKTIKAMQQFDSSGCSTQLLVLNIMTPMASLDQTYVDAAREQVRQDSNSTVEPVILFYHALILDEGTDSD